VPQVTQAVLESYADRGNRMAELFLEWSLMEKLRGTFVEGLSALLTYHDGDDLPRIHTGFKQHGTVTGRLSSARPNLQQLPRGSTIRDLFVAGPGRVLIVADYDQVELRCTAQQSGDRVMTQVFKEGRDIHAQAAAGALRIPADKVTSDQRQVGKTLNFATLYGAAESKIASVAGGSKQRGREFLDRYYAQFAGLKPWKSRVLREARERGDRGNLMSNPPAVVIPPIGRLRRLPDLFINPNDRDEGWRCWRAERQAINAVIQGYASYITKMAMLELAPILREYPARMTCQVHDEIVVSVDERWVHEVEPLVVATMGGIRGTDGQPILGDIPLIASAGVGYSWAKAKAKG
jgi:DNA polymerase-1